MRMRILFLSLATAVGWGWASVAAAQLDLSWSFAHNRTVLMEPIRATVRITNHSGRDLDLGPGGNARLRFRVEDQPSSVVPATGEPLVRRAFSVPNGETREVMIDLLDGYRIVQGQSYMVSPLIEVGGMSFPGRRLALEVQPGLELLRRDYGLPAFGEARRVSLRTIHRERSDRLFLRVDNAATGFCLGVYDLGRLIRFFKPRIEQDRDGLFHVLHQSGPDRFVHSVFDFNGFPSGQTIYAGEMASLRLTRGDDGAVQVTGGTPYEDDPENPGMLIAPERPPSPSQHIRMGELPMKRQADREPARRRNRSR